VLQRRLLVTMLKSRRAVRLSLAFALVLGFAAQTTTLAQEAPLTVEVVGASAQSASEAQAIVNVLADGRPVADLSKEQFQVQIGGSAVPVTAVSQGEDSSLGIAVVLFYVVLTPVWLGLRVVAWMAELKARRRA